VKGVPATALSWADLAAEATLAAESDFEQDDQTFPFGCHVAVVEVDVETGEARLVRHIAVDDCGKVLNPMLVNGQIHGGVAQGVGQALYEEFVYDAEGNPLTTSLIDYVIPSIGEIPAIETADMETPTPLNPLGAKGIGESGTIGSTPAVQNAVIDAVSHLGVRHIDMPLHPMRVWEAIRSAAQR
jgi:carbon-monoxide dehydrogenase large subunit